MLSDFALASVVLGTVAVLLGLLLTGEVMLIVLRRRAALRGASRSLPHFALVHPSLACTCPAHLAACACADQHGVRNPRGAGRGRMRGAS